jgi:tRNA(fMet)-specific endonuclease VapC
MKIKYILDTGWIIRHLRGIQSYTKAIQSLGGHHLGISIASIAELYEGIARSKNGPSAERTLREFFSDKIILPITRRTCRIFGEEKAGLRRTNRLIGDFDILIAATCLEHRATLLTTNKEHFQRLPGLQIIEHPEGPFA